MTLSYVFKYLVDLIFPFFVQILCAGPKNMFVNGSSGPSKNSVSKTSMPIDSIWTAENSAN